MKEGIKVTELEQLHQYQQTFIDYRYALGMISWDIHTHLNPNAMPQLAQSMSTLQRLYLDSFYSPEFEALIESLSSQTLGEVDAMLVKKLKKELDKTKMVPKELMIALSKLQSQGEAIWVKAKKENDFKSFAPFLKEFIQLKKEIIEHRNVNNMLPYDIILDDFEEGLTVQRANAFFDELKKGLVPLIHKIKEQPRFNHPFMVDTYSIDGEREISEYLLKHITFDLTRGRIGETEHPFCSGLNCNDVRLATHYHANNLMGSIFGIIHEGGHGLYEQNRREDIANTLLNGGASFGIHESISRFYENMLGRQPAFWEPIMPTLKRIFPQFESVSMKTFVEGINESKPSLIRIEADELTYSLHIMIRYEIEKMIFNEDLDLDTLPEVWNEKVKEYLGLDVPSDSVGVLQDTHWASGLFGYFPSYAIGSANAAQIYQAMNKDMNIEEVLKSGDLNPIREWLYERIFQYGELKTADEVMIEATGELLNPQYYIDYLVSKYATLYQL